MDAHHIGAHGNLYDISFPQHHVGSAARGIEGRFQIQGHVVVRKGGALFVLILDADLGGVHHGLHDFLGFLGLADFLRGGAAHDAGALDIGEGSEAAGLLDKV